MPNEQRPKDGPLTRIIGALLILAFVLPCLVGCAWVLVVTW